MTLARNLADLGNQVDSSGTLGIGGGGTSATTANASFNALAPSQTGNSGKVLTTDGTNTSWVTIGGSSLTATASGALANGDKVIVNSDGTVSVIAQTTSTTPSSGTPVGWGVYSNDYISSAYDSTAQKVVIAYRDGNNNDYGTAIVGTVSGTSISFGTPVVFNSGNTPFTSCVYEPNQSKIVIFYKDSSNAGYGTGIVGTVSGTSISFGTEYVFNSGSTEYISTAWDSNAQKIVIAYRDNANAYYGTAKVASVSGTQLSFGSATVFTSTARYETAIAYDSNAQKVVICFVNQNNSDYGTAIVGTVSGTSISFGSPTVFNSGTTAFVAIAYDSNAQKVVVVYRNDSNSSYGTAIIGTISGTSISFGTAVAFNSVATLPPKIVYDSNAGKMSINYPNESNSSYGTSITGTVSGTSISFGSTTVFQSSGCDYITATYDSTNYKVVVTYRNQGDSYKGTSVVVSPVSLSTNLTSENYIGISNAAYSNGDTATIQIVGAVDDAQTGLTAGQAYYVQSDGTLSQTAGTPSVFAGTAVSSTKIIVKG